MKKEFWKNWRKITKLEETAIESIKKARRILLQSVPKDRIMAIYVKGSFVRREMTKKSDVDIVPIVKGLETKKAIQKLDNEKGTFGFRELVKQVFWLTDLEEQINGNKTAVSWKELANSIRDKNHIIHDALKFRLHPTKDKIKRGIFIVKLRKHLELFV